MNAKDTHCAVTDDREKLIRRHWNKARNNWPRLPDGEPYPVFSVIVLPDWLTPTAFEGEPHTIKVRDVLHFRIERGYIKEGSAGRMERAERVVCEGVVLEIFLPRTSTYVQP